jgi:Domain of unknown function (DUF4390)
MVSITPAWKKSRCEGVHAIACVKGLWGVLRSALVRMLVVALIAGPALARGPEVLQSALLRQTDGLQLSVRLALAPSPAVEDALLKGVPVYFVWQSEVVRERWYWTDQRIGSATRTLRLAFQPLTRRWRVSLSTDGAAKAAGLQYALHQNFDSLAEALVGISRVAGWQIVEPGRLENGERFRARWRFRLDLSLLPRPFQIGMANQPDWLIEVQRELDVPPNNELEPRPEGAVPANAVETR